jgi:hypothetical protein
LVLSPIFQTSGTVVLAVDGGATSARNGLENLDLFAATGALDNMPDVDDAIVASVGALQAGVMRLYGVVVVVILGRWVRGLRCRLTLAAHGATPPE